MIIKKYKNLYDMFRDNDLTTFSMKDFLDGQVYNRCLHEWIGIELSDEALRELSNGFCSALNCQKRKYDVVFENMKLRKIKNCGILERLWVGRRELTLYYTYCVGQDGNVEYPLVKKILYAGR